MNGEELEVGQTPEMNETQGSEINFKDLKKEIPYKWKVQTCGQYGTTLVAFIDARDAEDLLDEVCGPENWKCAYQMTGNQMLCAISIKCGDEWVSKSDGGTESNVEKEKGLLSDCFKRAAVKWGVGRFLYRKGNMRLNSVDTGKKKDGNIVYAPAHNAEKHGPATDVPFGLLKWDFQNKQPKLEIKEMNRYIWEFLKPFNDKKKVQNKT